MITQLLRCTAVAAIALAAPAWAQDFSPQLKAYGQRVPAPPASVAAAAARFTYNAQNGETLEPAELPKLRKDLELIRETINLSANAQMPGGAMTPEAARQLEAKIQAMSQAEQMAYAMQMQQQMMAQMGGGGFSVTPDEQAAVEQAQQESLKVNADTEMLIALDRRAEDFIADWDRAGETEYVPHTQNPANYEQQFCTEQARSTQLQSVQRGMARVSQQLAKLAPLEKELRLQEEKLLARAQRLEGLTARLKSPALLPSAAATRTRAQTNVVDLIEVHARLYSQVGVRAASWQHYQLITQKAPLTPTLSECLAGN